QAVGQRVAAPRRPFDMSVPNRSACRTHSSGSFLRAVRDHPRRAAKRLLRERTVTVLSSNRRTAGGALEPRAPMQPPPKRTKIAAPVGPASRDPAMLRSLFLAGVNVVRLNFSHGTHDEAAEIIADVRAIARELNLYVAILQDLPGPKVRTGGFA